MVHLCVTLALLSITLPWQAEGVMWHLEPNTQKCLKEELQQNVLVTGEYEVSVAPSQKVHYIVRDPKGHILLQKEDMSAGKFSFITETYGTFEVCLVSFVPAYQRGVRQEVSLVIKHGIEAKSYELQKILSAERKENTIHSK